MAEGKTMRLNKVLRELNISLDRAVEHLSKNGHEIEARPTTKISGEVYQVLLDGFQTIGPQQHLAGQCTVEMRDIAQQLAINGNMLNRFGVAGAIDPSTVPAGPW